MTEEYDGNYITCNKCGIIHGTLIECPVEMSRTETIVKRYPISDNAELTRLRELEKAVGFWANLITNSGWPTIGADRTLLKAYNELLRRIE